MTDDEKTMAGKDCMVTGAMVAHLGQEYCVDSSRIGMTGYSDGGFMAFHMACVGAPWLAAIAPVGVTQPWVLTASDCSFGHPVSLLDFSSLASGEPSVPVLPTTSPYPHWPAKLSTYSWRSG